jgi:hypothetical protein
MNERTTLITVLCVYTLLAIYGINQDDIDSVIRDIAAALLSVQ